MQRIDVVVGAQYGSEGKGHVTAQLVAKAVEQARGESITEVINVRVAGPNAGHTVYDENGVKFALRQIPVGAAISDHVTLYIAPGSEIDIDVIEKEVTELRAAGHPLSRLVISTEVTVIDLRHVEREQTFGLTVDSGNSTGKGIGAARADRLLRKADRLEDAPSAVAKLAQLGFRFAEPAALYSDDRLAANRDQHIIIEGTQGYGLGLHAGFYPKCTSSDCRAIDFLAMAGISPWRIELEHFNVWVVARVYPIRIAGNSGPMEGETSWGELGLPEELTTVTQRVRRVGQWDADLVADAVQANGGMSRVKLALTMLDQKFPQVRDLTNDSPFVHEGKFLNSEVAHWLKIVSIDVRAELGMVTTSPTTAVWF